MHPCTGVRLCTGRTAYRGSTGVTILFLDHGTRRGERSLPPGKTRYPLYRRLGGHHGRSGQVRKISSLPGFDPWTAQPVASRYTYYATRLTKYRARQSLFSTVKYTVVEQSLLTLIEGNLNSKSSLLPLLRNMTRTLLLKTKPVRYCPSRLMFWRTRFITLSIMWTWHVILRFVSSGLFSLRHYISLPNVFLSHSYFQIAP